MTGMALINIHVYIVGLINYCIPLICIKEQYTTISSYLSYYTEFLDPNREVLSAELSGILCTY